MCPGDLFVDKNVIEDESTDNEDSTVEVFKLWFINDGCQDKVDGHQDH